MRLMFVLKFRFCSIRLTAFDTAKNFIAAGKKELDSITEENKGKEH